MPIFVFFVTSLSLDDRCKEEIVQLYRVLLRSLDWKAHIYPALTLNRYSWKSLLLRLWYDTFLLFFFLFLMVLCFVSYLIDHLQAMPDDLKTKLIIDEDIVSSPKEALSRASAERVGWRNKNFRRYSPLILIACTCAHYY